MVYPILKITLVPFIRSFMKEIKGKENVPKDKAFIIACNHASFYDDLAIPCIIAPIINKRIHFYVSHKYFKNYFIRKFLEHGGPIPIVTTKTKNSKKINEEGFKKALYYLRKKEPVAIFPEGTRSFNGKLQKPKTGIAYLVLNSKVPVLPIGIKGSYKILPKGSFFPRLKRCKVKIGKLMHFGKYYNKKINKKSLTEITRQIMKQVAKLNEQEYRF